MRLESGEMLPEGWRWMPLGEVVAPDKQLVQAGSDDAQNLTYLSMEHIESLTGRILKVPIDKPEDEGKSTTYRFTPNHILYGKLRPYLNKVAEPNFEGRCTTELVPLLPKSVIDRRFLVYTLRRKEIADAAMRGKTGARMPRANMDELLKEEIPLPPLPEQKRIAAILTERLAAVERARKASDARLQAARALPTAYLREIFESGEARGWKKQPLGELVSEFRYGTSNKSAKSGYLTLRIPNIIGNDISLEDLVNVPVTDEEVSRLRLMDGDVLFVRTNGSPEYIARSAVFRQSKFVDAGIDPEQIIYASYLIRARLISSRLNPLFLQAYLRTREGREAIFGKCKTTAGQYNINTQGLGSLEIPVPPMALQDEIVNALGSKFSKSTVIVGIAEQAQEAVEALSASLLRQAFSGAL